jgi:hypothetical protein
MSVNQAYSIASRAYDDIERQLFELEVEAVELNDDQLGDMAGDVMGNVMNDVTEVIEVVMRLQSRDRRGGDKIDNIKVLGRGLEFMVDSMRELYYSEYISNPLDTIGTINAVLGVMVTLLKEAQTSSVTSPSRSVRSQRSQSPSNGRSSRSPSPTRSRRTLL